MKELILNPLVYLFEYMPEIDAGNITLKEAAIKKYKWSALNQTYLLKLNEQQQEVLAAYRKHFK